MPRRCSVCDHDEAHAINVGLVQRSSYRAIADRYGVSESALKRHSADHLPKLLVEAKQAVEVADADDLLGRVESLQERTLAILEAAEDTGELKTALGAIRECRGNLELLAKLLGQLDERPQVNLFLSPEWLELRTTLVYALDAYPEARESVLRAIEGVGNGRA